MPARVPVRGGIPQLKTLVLRGPASARRSLAADRGTLGFVLTAPGFPQGQCYTAIQGTAMAAPHVAGALALSATAHPSLRKHPGRLVARLKAYANSGVHNLTRALSATDTATSVAPGSPTARATAPGW